MRTWLGISCKQCTQKYVYNKSDAERVKHAHMGVLGLLLNSASTGVRSNTTTPSLLVEHPFILNTFV